jgi:hypothetical protein
MLLPKSLAVISIIILVVGNFLVYYFFVAPLEYLRSLPGWTRDQFELFFQLQDQGYIVGLIINMGWLLGLIVSIISYVSERRGAEEIKIPMYEGGIHFLAKKRRCRLCGNSSENRYYCSACIKKMGLSRKTRREEAEIIICPHCQVEITGVGDYCPRCGGELEG